jgi:hypothetical protein
MYLLLYFLGKDLYKWNSNLHIVERQYMHHFDYHKPTSLEDALHRASTAPGSSVYLAGGTDVLVLIKQGKIRPQQVIDVKGIPEINGIDISEDGCFIGALTTIRTLEKSQAVAVEVDRDSGKVDVLKVIAVHNVGKAVFRAGIEGQIQGGVAMGLGYALSEETIFSDGKPLNDSFLDYRLPTMMDVPAIIAVIVEYDDPKIPDDIRGVGEPPAAPTAAAVANAVYDAVGVRLNQLPLTPERVYRALQNKDASRG